MEIIKAKFIKQVFSKRKFRICFYAPVEDSVPEDHEKIDKTGRKFISVKGECLPIQANACYTLEGEWESTEKYGWTFKAEISHLSYEKTEQGIITYMQQIPGIRKLAKRVYEQYGDQSPEMIRNDPNCLKPILGFGKGRIVRVENYFNGIKEKKKCIENLLKYGLSTSLANQLYDEDPEIANHIPENPYLLCKNSVERFPLAEKIACEKKTQQSSPGRVEYGIDYTLYLDERILGNVFEDYETLAEIAGQVFRGKSVTSDDIQEGIHQAAQDRKIFIQRYGKRVIVYSDRMYYAEKGSAVIVAQMLTEKIKDLSEVEIMPAIYRIERTEHFILDKIQKRALIFAVKYPISIITGGPGTGKTTTLKIFTKLCRKLWPFTPIVLMAPTGRAARKMSNIGKGELDLDSKPLKSYTIHHVFDLPSDLNRKRVKYDICSYGKSEGVLQQPIIYIVDEVSMVDIQLFQQILIHISKGSKLVLVGDPAQLPSVGPGNVLRDLIESGVVPMTMLNVIHRQTGNESHIAINADRINHNDNSMILDNDFQFIESHNVAETENLIITTFLNEYKAGTPIDDLQILSPYKNVNYPCSTVNINKKIQSILNPGNDSEPESETDTYVFRVGDKVIQGSNSQFCRRHHETIQIMNGDIGYIKKIIPTDTNVITVIDFGDDRVVSYGMSELEKNKVTLAYAITVHKSQGSEYSTIIMPVIKEHRNMLQRNLVYTAITRASRKVILIGEMEELKEAIAKNRVTRRNTLFTKRLIKYYEMLQRKKQRKDKIAR
jgi:exodeoxyribonuclease V alpha subunit